MGRLPKEEWKHVEGTGEYYSVSSYGNVRCNGLDRRIFGRNKYKYGPLKPTVSKQVVKIAFTLLDGSRQWWQLKDLVAHHFIEPNVKVRLKDRSNPFRCNVRNIVVIKKKEKK